MKNPKLVCKRWKKGRLIDLAAPPQVKLLIVTLAFLSKAVQLEIATSNPSVLGTLWTPSSCPTLKSALLLAIPMMIATGKQLLKWAYASGDLLNYLLGTL